MAVVVGLLIVIGNLLYMRAGHAATLPQGFADRIALSGLTRPTNLEFAPDGRVFVAEKSGLVKVFQSLNDTTPTVFADLRTEVDDYWDRGLLGLALDPQFPARPYVYVLYTYDHVIGDPAAPPKWGDACPTPPGPTTDGCVVSGRLSRLTADGNTMVPGDERVLIEGWCQQFPSHTVGDLAFGPDGALYVSGGDGASFSTVDYGQFGGQNAGFKANPCGDPPSPAGTALAPPGAQGGALRSQSLRRPAGQPNLLSGALLRVDPDSGAALPDNPLASRTDANAKRIVAYGMRNPFRFTFRPGTGEVWIGDVGWGTWEEIDRVADPTARVINFGWPCFEGAARQPSYDAADLSSCESLYSAGGATGPYYAYRHGDAGGVVPGDGCPAPGSASITGVAFYQRGAYPAKYNGALFFSDYTRKCIWTMLAGTNGLPDPTRREALVTGASGGAVDLEIGPGGDLFYVDMSGGSVHRIVYSSGNQAPIAVAGASRTSGPAPLTVTFDATGSRDPDPSDTITYGWDFTSDGAVDSTQAQPSFTYQSAGRYLATLHVTDNHGAESTDAVAITVGNTPPVVTIESPTPSLTWKVGDTIRFSGHATDAEEGSLPPSRLSWSLVLHHCTAPTDCHVHPLQDFPAVGGGSFAAPDHEYPSWLELSLKGTDSGGLSDEASVRLDPKAVNLTFTSSPTTGLQLAVGAATGTTPFTRTVIVGSANSVSAPTPQTLSSGNYSFAKWSDGGARSHTVTAGDWNGDGVDTVGTFVKGAWYLRDSNTTGPYESRVGFGAAGDIPVVGDWNGDGADTVGTFRDGVWNLRNSNSAGPPDLTTRFGQAGDIPVVGDWNGDGVDTIGVFRAGTWYLRMSSNTGSYSTVAYGRAGDAPVAGDWNGDGTDTVGTFVNGVWYLRNLNTTGPYQLKVGYGGAGDVPKPGDWNNDGTDTVATFR